MTEKPATRASQAPPAPGTPPPDPEPHPARADASEGRTEAPPSGCTYCGVPERGHFQRWASPLGWHAWTAPTDAQTKQRMIARRADRITRETS